MLGPPSAMLGPPSAEATEQASFLVSALVFTLQGSALYKRMLTGRDGVHQNWQGAGVGGQLVAALGWC